MPEPSQRGAIFVLRELGAEVRRAARLVIEERERLAERLSGRGFSVAPSAANFLWVEGRRPADELTRALAERGVLIKSFGSRGGRLARRLRITVGLPAENDRLLAELEACV